VAVISFEIVLQPELIGSGPFRRAEGRK
jgi:hypothetical protein